MSISTDPADAVVQVTSTVVAGGMLTTEQGSGVLIAPGEVLTAAHVVYDAAGRLFPSTTVTVGGTAVAAAAVHAMPDADWTRLASAGGDFALIHLAAPIADAPTMALGSGFTGGAVTVTGYPDAAMGARDSLAEALSAVPGVAGVLAGTALGAPGDPRGGSGGPAWTGAGGAATVVGLVQSFIGSTGYFVGLTAADAAQVRAWEAADSAAPAAAASTTAASTTVAATTVAAGFPIQPTVGPAAAAAADLAGEVGGVPALGAGRLADAAARLVAVLQADAAAPGGAGGFDAAAAAALPDLGAHPLAAALLEGVGWGHAGGDVAGSVAAVAAADPGVLSGAGRERAVRAGAALGGLLLADGF